MGSVVVVVVSPVFEDDAGFEEVGEVLDVEAFVSEAAVERLDPAVLPGGARLDAGGVGGRVPAPVPQRVGGELGTVVHAQMGRCASSGGDLGDDFDGAVGVDAVTDVDGQGFSGELVDDVEQLEAPPGGGLVELEIERPHVIGVLGSQLRRGAVAEALPFVAPLRGPLNTMGAPQPQSALGIDRQAFAGGDVVGLAPSPARMGLRETAQPLPIGRVRVSASCWGRRWVERCWPTTRHARRWDTPNRSWSRTTAARRRSGVTIFPPRGP